MGILGLLGFGVFFFFFIAPIIALARTATLKQQTASLRDQLSRVEDELFRLKHTVNALQLAASENAKSSAMPLPSATMANLAQPDVPPVAISPHPPLLALPPQIVAPTPPPPEPILAPVAPPVSLPDFQTTAFRELLEPPKPAQVALEVQAEVPVLQFPPAEEAPPAPPAQRFDFEALLGVRGAAWLGAIAMVIAALLFVKYSIESGLTGRIPKEVRVGLLLALGLGSLLGSEFGLRRRYAVTANALCGAGVAVLYGAFFAAKQVYALIPMPPTFVLMVLTTALAAGLSLRYQSVWIAVLGLCGGFVTPVVLSSGQDHPAGLFAYVFLMDLGFLFISARQGWARLAATSLALTTLLALGWAIKHLSPEKAPIAAVAFLVLAILYLVLPSLAGKVQRQQPRSYRLLLGVAVTAGLAPFAFAFYLSGALWHDTPWPLLLGFLACLDAALLVVGTRRAQAFLVVAAALATALTLLIWDTRNLPARSALGPTLAILGLFVLCNAGPRLRRLLSSASKELETDENSELGQRMLLEVAGLIGLFGLLFHGLVLVHVKSEPPWPFLLLLLTGLVLSVERGRPGSLRLALPVLSGLIAGLAQHWLFYERLLGNGDDLLLLRSDLWLRDLCVPLWLSAGFGVAAALGAGRAAISPPSSQLQNAKRWHILTDTQAIHGGEIAALIATVMGALGLIAAAVPPATGHDAWPLLLTMAGYVLLLLLSALRRNWTKLLLVALGLATALCASWQGIYLQPSDRHTLIPIYWSYYAFFLLILGILSRYIGAWRTRISPRLTMIGAGPSFLLLLYYVTTAPLPTFAGLTLYVAALLVLGQSKKWLALLPYALGFSAALCGLWHIDARPALLGAYFAFYLFFLIAPVVLRPLLSEWRTNDLPFYTSLLAGPAFFALFYDCGLTPLLIALALYVAMGFVLARWRDWGWVVLLELFITAGLCILWVDSHTPEPQARGLLLWEMLFYVAFLAVPLILCQRRPALRASWTTIVAIGLAGPALFFPIYRPFVQIFGRDFLGILPLLFAFGSVLALSQVRNLVRPDSLEPAAWEEQKLANLALLAAVALGFLALAIPLQLHRQWITVAWAIEAAAVFWLYRRLPHPGLKYFGLLLYVIVALRLWPTEEVLHYHERGHILINWLLYTYGVPTLCFLLGALGLAPVEESHRRPREPKLPLSRIVSTAGVLLLFVLINLEIFDAFSAGHYVELGFERSYVRDLTMSLSWGGYAILLLCVGMWRQNRVLRLTSFAFLFLAIAKVFFYDLSNVHGIYRSLSFLGLAFSLILVSLLYQRFVFKDKGK